MKYGIYFAYWTKEWQADYKYYIQKVKKLGFDVLEISCMALRNVYLKDEQLLDLKKCAEDQGIIMTAGYGPTKEQNLCSGDPAVVKRGMDFFKGLLPRLQLMDIKVLGGGLYSYWPLDPAAPMDKEADLERAIKNMKELSKIAEDCDVTLGMEVLNRYEGYMLNTCEQALEFVNAVDSSHVKIMLDTFHMNIEEDNIGAAIRKAGRQLGHLHVGEQNRRVPGKGSLPWAEIGQALKDIDYQGAVVMEPFVMSGGTVGSEIKVWRDLAPDATEEMLDNDARGAVEFLRHVFGN
ncbi:sugar phosphate isomerase/epimerase [Muricomes sp. OA1]|uniref:D-psicose 3-epimerase n=1 Tax=Hungatella hathewayi TaxID=154046 RepID=A0A3E2X1F2_9FIRM|nr:MULTISPECIES: sugar phosphate isomerase/epimerase family protein [Clostridia]MCH1971074.1 sugar phosphate isomerase/epimerase [Muricomes sp. OA1]RGC35108.1 sugar phosphate isomerase/epimerase [Hungatella hathewayi]GKH34365.1 D-psicose 3-epimerase [Faecalicatena contorta]